MTKRTITVLVFLILIALIASLALSIRLAPIIGHDGLVMFGITGNAILLVFSFHPGLRNFMMTHEGLGKVVWILCVLGVCTYPVFVINFWLHPIGDMRAISYREAAKLPAFVEGLIGIFASFVYFARVIHGNDFYPQVHR